MLQFPRLREENAGHITVTVPDMPQAEARAILNDLGRGSWLEPGPIGSLTLLANWVTRGGFLG